MKIQRIKSEMNLIKQEDKKFIWNYSNKPGKRGEITEKILKLAFASLPSQVRISTPFLDQRDNTSEQKYQKTWNMIRNNLTKFDQDWSCLYRCVAANIIMYGPSLLQNGSTFWLRVAQGVWANLGLLRLLHSGWDCCIVVQWQNLITNFWLVLRTSLSLLWTAQNLL